MIKSFAHKGLERFFNSSSKAGIAAVHGPRLRLLLSLLHEAVTVDDLGAPGTRLHALKGDRAGYWSLTVQANWRLIFKFEAGNAHVVDYLDYH